MGGLGEMSIYDIQDASAAMFDNDKQPLAPGDYPAIVTDRVLYKGLNTIVLPFEATVKDLDDNGGAKVLEYIGTIERDGNLILQFKPVETLAANTPYAVFANADIQIEFFENKTVVAPTDLTVSDSEYAFVGTYTASEKGESPIVEGDLIADVNEFTKANGGNKIRAYRAYLKKVGTSSANVAFDFDGDLVDGIEAARLLDTLTQGDIYNLNGQKVTKPNKGVYIVNGKKTVIK